MGGKVEKEMEVIRAIINDPTTHVFEVTVIYYCFICIYQYLYMAVFYETHQNRLNRRRCVQIVLTLVKCHPPCCLFTPRHCGKTPYFLLTNRVRCRVLPVLYFCHVDKQHNVTTLLLVSVSGE